MPLTPEELKSRRAAIRLLAMDVDGVLTDGLIILGSAGDAVVEAKAFNVRDGLGISVALAAGIPVAWVTGRTSDLVKRRAAELRVPYLVQWARNKRVSLERLAAETGISLANVAYIGDDLNDMPAFGVCGLRIAVANAAPEVKAAADWVTEGSGGRGAVREVVEGLLRARGGWEDAVAAFLQRLEAEHDRPPGASAQ